MKTYTFLLLILILSACNQKNSFPLKGEGESSGTPSIEKEKREILAIINKEYEAYFNKDYDQWKSCFVQEAYLKYWGYWDGYPEKIRAYHSWAELDQHKRKRMEGTIKSYWDNNEVGMDMEDLNIQVRGNVSWVTFISTSKDRKTGELLGRALETKILEKVAGNWKIAYLNFLYLPSAQDL